MGWVRLPLTSCRTEIGVVYSRIPYNRRFIDECRHDNGAVNAQNQWLLYLHVKQSLQFELPGFGLQRCLNA